MNKIVGFIKSPVGKFLIVAIVVVVVGYLAFIQYEKSMYNGNTKKDIEKGLVDKVSKDRVTVIKGEDLNFINGTYPLVDILKWYDENDPRVVSDVQLTAYLNSLGIDSDKRADFSYLVGTPLKLVNYA